MALDVYLQPRPEMPRIGGEYEYVCSFDDDDVYYRFLYPLFVKLAEQTGQLIDLYDMVAFAGDTLDALAQTLTAAYALADAQPDTWEVVIGVRMGPIPEEVRCTISRQELYALLDKLSAAARKAKAAGVYLKFVGD